MMQSYPVGGVLYLLVNFGLMVLLPFWLWDWNRLVLIIGIAVWLGWMILMTSVIGEAVLAWFCGSSPVPYSSKEREHRIRAIRLHNVAQEAYRKTQVLKDGDQTYQIRMMRNDLSAIVKAIGRHTIVISKEFVYLTIDRQEAELAYAMLELEEERPMAYLWLFSSNAVIALPLILLELLRKGVQGMERLCMPKMTWLTVVDRVLAVPLCIWCRFSSVFFAFGMKVLGRMVDSRAAECEWAVLHDNQKQATAVQLKNPFLRALGWM